jgi:hypothetical protein
LAQHTALRRVPHARRNAGTEYRVRPAVVYGDCDAHTRDFTIDEMIETPAAHRRRIPSSWHMSSDTRKFFWAAIPMFSSFGLLTMRGWLPEYR